jgi:hypothetical protein
MVAAGTSDSAGRTAFCTGLEPQVPTCRPRMIFYQRNQVLIFLARRLLVLPIDTTPSSFIYRGALLDLSLQADETITINGVLVPVSWNPSGEVVCVAVSTFDEKEYRLAGHDAADQWQDHLNREVSIQGRPFQRGVEQWIAVRAFHIIQSDQNPELNKK